MPLKVTFELGDRDLQYFRKVMRDAIAAAKSAKEEDLIGGARTLLGKTQTADLPVFVRERLQKLETLIAMAEDDEWALAGGDRQRVIQALAYFNEPLDLIADDVPGLGFLDDAVMVELVVQELKHDIEAYADFCVFRDKETRRERQAADVSRDEWLEARRRQLHQRMRRRRQRERSAGRSSRLW